MVKIKHHYFLFLMTVTLPLAGFSFINFETRAITWDWFVLVLLIFTYYASNSVIEQIKFKRDQVLFFLVLFNLFLMLSGLGPFLSGDTTRILDFLSCWPQYILFSLGFVVASSLRCQSSDVRLLLRFYIIVACAVAMFGIIQVISSWVFNLNLYPELSHVKYTTSESGYEFYLGGLTRAASIFEEPRQFGVFLNVAFFIAFIAFRCEPQIFQGRLKKKIIFLILLLGVFVSLATSAFLCFIMMTIIIGVFFGSYWRQKILTMLCWFLLLILLYSIVLKTAFEVDMVGYLMKRLSSLTHGKELFQFDFELGGGARYIRGSIVAVKLGLENPALGVGLNQWHQYLNTPDIEFLGLVVPAPFDLFASIGIVGSLSFICFLAILINKAWGLRKKVQENNRYEIDTAIALIVLPLIATSINSGYQYNTSFFWLPIYIASIIIYNMPTWSMNYNSQDKLK